MRKYYFTLVSLSLIFALACSEDEPAPQTNPAVEDFAIAVDENPQSGQVLGSVLVKQSTGNLTYSLGTQNPAGALRIDAQSGELSVANESLFNFEVNPVISGTVSVTDDIGTGTASITVTLNNVDESDLFDVWSGPELNFTKVAGADPGLAENQDQIAASVAITRGNDGGQIYNAVTESSADQNNSPAGTLWAVGTVENIEALEFKKFRDAVGDPKNVAGKNLILYLEAENVYIPLSFTMWSQGKTNGGGFAYTRATEN